MAAFADLWYATPDAADADLPAKDDFKLKTLTPFLSHVAMVRRRKDGTPYYYFYGTELARELARGDALGGHFPKT